jgi:hypothetical protein
MGATDTPRHGACRCPVGLLERGVDLGEGVPFRAGSGDCGSDSHRLPANPVATLVRRSSLSVHDGAPVPPRGAVVVSPESQLNSTPVHRRVVGVIAGRESSRFRGTFRSMAR